MKWNSKALIVLSALALCVFGLTNPSFAEEKVLPEENTGTCPICRHANKQSASYGEKASTTLIRGAANTLLGWTEAIRQPAEVTKSGGGVLKGVVKGLNDGVERTLVGVGELLTFWVPKVQDKYPDITDHCPICIGTKNAKQVKPSE